ncbi:hypothetical protein ACHAXT_008634 [Thalassiosira profunda]
MSLTGGSVAAAAAAATAAALSLPRAGAQPPLATALSAAAADPISLFDSLLVVLATGAVGLKAVDRFAGDGRGGASAKAVEEKDEKPAAVTSMQRKFLAAFWLLRCGYWMSGPYVVPAYRSKVFNGVEASLGLVSKIFLTGFAATAIAGTVAFALLYSIGVATIKSNELWVLFAGRAVVGCALSLLSSAPEAWVSGEAGRLNLRKYLGETFGLAYTGDALVAIIAGKLASWAASAQGVTAPFDLSIVFLAAGAAVSSLFWKENKAVVAKAAAAASTKGDDATQKATKGSIKEAFEIVRGDQRLMLVGAVQSLFEAAMYVFILQWPSAIAGAVSSYFGEGSVTPFGTIFSCFMACSLLGSLCFGKLIKRNTMTESSATGMLTLSALSMGLGAYFTAGATTNLPGITAAFLLYEACVGLYFPAIGTLRSKYVPDEHKSVILSMFGIPLIEVRKLPLNTLVVLAYMFTKELGMSGALGVSSAALAIATGCMAKLRSIAKKDS